MPIHIRQVSLLLRRRNSLKDRERVLSCFEQWREVQQRALPAPQPRARNLLIVRLDDLGDYVLFRNQLATYRRSPRWRGHRITLLGNSAWRELFTALDADSVDEVIWVSKSRYLLDAAHRLETWRAVRQGGFDTVVAASRTRPLLLDDLCMLAAAPRSALGAANDQVHAPWRRLSDALYGELFAAAPLQHEFIFNARFGAWICGTPYAGGRPRIALPPAAATAAVGAAPYLVCCIGASTRSKRWPVKRWIEFLRGVETRAVLVGAGEQEADMARRIAAATAAEDRVGKVSLTGLLPLIAAARAVVSNDTLAAHLGAALDRPTVIVANGVNYLRFADYAAAGIGNVATVYPAVFLRHRRRNGEGRYDYESAITADIASIRGASVRQRLGELLH